MYGTQVASDHSTVLHSWSCVSGDAGIRIRSGGAVLAVCTSNCDHALAVVPAPSGKTMPFIIIVTVDSSELLVLSLPGLSLVHTHRLEGMQVTGLAADLWGAALAVCDHTS